MEEKDDIKLRFAIGAEVACNMGDEWAEGRVVQHFYTQRGFPSGYCAAYQVKLNDGGRLIFAPRDHDGFIGVPMAAKEAAWDTFFSNAVAAGHMQQAELDELTDALAETSTTDERRDLLEMLAEDESLQDGCCPNCGVALGAPTAGPAAAGTPAQTHAESAALYRV